MADEPDSPRKFYQLKPREFEVVNELSAAVPPGRKHDPLHPNRRIEVRELYQQANTPGPVLPVGEKIVLKNEVHTLLHDNLVRANAGGLNELTSKPKRRSRRTRDFFAVVIPLDLLFGYAAFGHYSNVAMMAYGVAGIIIATIGLGWVMFFVMDDY